MSEHSVARLEEIDEVTDGRCPWRPVRQHFGISSFGVNTWTGHDAGDRIINEHDEEGEDEELYLVHTGRARFELDGEAVDAPAGTLVFVEPGVKRTAFAEEPGTTLIALGGEPGKPYHPTGYELWAPLNPLYESGSAAGGAGRGRGVPDPTPQPRDPPYTTPCGEPPAGGKADAPRPPRPGFEAPPPMREFAAGDSDLD